MSIEKREQPRIKVELKIAYEFVKWNEKFLYELKKPLYATSFDISITGIGLKKLDGLTDKILKNLEKGELKIKLAIYLEEENPPLLTFARLIWSDQNNNTETKLGLLFIDVTEDFLLDITKFIENSKKKKIKV